MQKKFESFCSIDVIVLRFRNDYCNGLKKECLIQHKFHEIKSLSNMVTCFVLEIVFFQTNIVVFNESCYKYNYTLLFPITLWGNCRPQFGEGPMDTIWTFTFSEKGTYGVFTCSILASILTILVTNCDNTFEY